MNLSEMSEMSKLSDMSKLSAMSRLFQCDQEPHVFPTYPGEDHVVNIQGLGRF